MHLCELAEVHILNGLEHQEPARYTCTTPQGSSCVDYLMSKDPSHQLQYGTEAVQAMRISDHQLLHLSLRVNIAPSKAGHVSRPQEGTVYRWNVGESIAEQRTGISKWRTHTNTPDFQRSMLAIVNNATLGNEERSEAMEKFLLEAGLSAGVLTASQIRTPLNPNRWGKKLAPWFDDACRKAKREYQECY